MDQDRDQEQRVEWARGVLARLRDRANGDPQSDPFAAKVQELRHRRASGLPVYTPEILAEGLKEYEFLQRVREARCKAMLSDD